MYTYNLNTVWLILDKEPSYGREYIEKATYLHKLFKESFLEEVSSKLRLEIIIG